MGIIQMTGWTLDYVMDKISLGAMITLLRQITPSDRPSGLWAQANLDKEKLKESGIRVI